MINLSIKSKLLIAFIFLVFISIAATTAAVYITIKSDVIDKKKNDLMADSFKTMDKIDRSIQNQFEKVKLWGRTVTLTSAINYLIYDEAIDFAKELVKENMDVASVSLLDKDCTVVASNINKLLNKKYEGFKCDAALSAFNAIFEEPAMDKETGDFVYTVIAPVKADKASGFLAVDFKWSELMKAITTRESRTDKSHDTVSYLLINKEGLLIGATDANLNEGLFKLNLLKEGVESAKLAAQEPSGAIVETGLNNTEVISGFYNSMGYLDWKGAGWKLFSVEKTSAALSALNKIGSKAAIIAVVMMLIGLLLSWVIVNNYISAPIMGLVAEFKRIAGGDLSGNFEIKSKDEFGTLAEAMKTMVVDLRSIVKSIFSNSEQISSATNEMVSISNQLNKGSEGLLEASENTLAAMTQSAASIRTVSENAKGLAQMVDEATSSVSELGSSVQSIADNTQNQSAAADQTVSAIEEIGKSIEEVTQIAFRQAKDMDSATKSVDAIVNSIEAVVNSIEEANTIAEKNTKDGEAGNNAVKLSADAMGRITEVMRSTAEAISKLGRRSDEIGKIIKVIDDITEQTNLLALNAAIIAAQAGEHGKGFAVVADEVRELANRSMLATKEIGGVIEGIGKETAEAVDRAINTLKETEESAKLSNVAGKAISNMLDGINQVAYLLSKISVSSQQQKELSKEIVNTMDNLNNITANVKRATTEQATASNQIRSAAENMMNITVEVAKSTREQAATSSEVVKTMAEMNAATQQVANAAFEQQKGVDMVVSAMKNVKEISNQNMGAVSQLSKSTDNLAQQGKNMAELINKFKI